MVGDIPEYCQSYQHQFNAHVDKPRSYTRPKDDKHKMKALANKFDTVINNLEENVNVKTHYQLLCTIIGHFLKKISLDGLISKNVFLYIRSAQMIYELC